MFWSTIITNRILFYECPCASQWPDLVGQLLSIVPNITRQDAAGHQAVYNMGTMLGNAFLNKASAVEFVCSNNPSNFYYSYDACKDWFNSMDGKAM